MPILKGNKVILRPYRREDAQHIPQWANDTDTTKYLSSFFWHPYTEQNAADFVDMAMRGSDRATNFVIADPETEAYLGQTDLSGIDRRNGTAIVGIVIAGEHSRGKGIGCEALQLLCRYAFMTLGLNRLVIDVFADNARARACYRKAGFIEEGVAREAMWSEGKFRDMVTMSMLRRDWDKMQEDAHHV